MPALISGLRPTWSESQPVSELAERPRRRVGGGDDRDLAPARAVRGQVQRHESPGQRIVEVVDQPAWLQARSTGRCRLAVREGRAKPVSGSVVPPACARCSSATCARRVAHEDDGDERADSGDDRRADPDDRARRVRRGERAGHERRGGDAQ